jgi:hypothetical protein
LCPYILIFFFLFIKIIATPEIIIAPPKYAYVFGVSLRIKIEVNNPVIGKSSSTDITLLTGFLESTLYQQL